MKKSSWFDFEAATRAGLRGILVGIVGLLGMGVAHAQEEQLDALTQAGDKIEEQAGGDAADKDKDPTGWTYGLKLGATVAWNISSNVVGNDDGSTVQIGGVLDGDLGFLSDDRAHDWDLTLKLQEAQTRTPQLATFLKSLDNFELNTHYIYHIPDVSWLGPYAQAGLTAPILRGFAVREGNTTVSRPNASGNGIVTNTVAGGEHIELTSSFEPLVLQEALGLFMKPYATEPFTFVSRVGIGFQQIITDGGFAVADNDATTALEITPLASSESGGGVLEIEMNGALAKNISWEASAKWLLPFFSNNDTTLSGTELLNQTYGADLSVKLASWVALDVVFRAKRIPLVLQEWQIQNGILLTTGFDLVKMLGV